MARRQHAGRSAERARATVIHNDFKYDNIVLDPNDVTRIVGVLDWEMATIGDPLTDLATSLAYWVEDGRSRAASRRSRSVRRTSRGA